MSTDSHAHSPGERRRRRRRVPRVIRHARAIVSSHAASAAWGGLSGLAAGAVSGAIAGPPGVVAGAVLGSAIGAAAGAAIGAGQEEQRREDEELDRVIGVTGGNIGEAQNGKPETAPEGTMLHGGEQESDSIES